MSEQIRRFVDNWKTILTAIAALVGGFWLAAIKADEVFRHSAMVPAHELRITASEHRIKTVEGDVSRVLAALNTKEQLDAKRHEELLRAIKETN